MEIKVELFANISVANCWRRNCIELFEMEMDRISHWYYDDVFSPTRRYCTG